MSPMDIANQSIEELQQHAFKQSHAELISALKGARDWLESIPDNLAGINHGDLDRQIWRANLAIKNGERFK